VVYVATTNYPKLLPARFTNRPTRFDLIVEIGAPSAAFRREFLSRKEPSLTAKELDAWVAKTDGFMTAHLRELIILERCYKYPLDEAVARLRSMMSDTQFDGYAEEPKDPDDDDEEDDSNSVSSPAVEAVGG